MVLAEHFTRVRPIVTTTLETVRFEPPEWVHFRLVRGPVLPHVVEQFRLRETSEGTELVYRGERPARSAPPQGRMRGAHPARTARG